MKAHELAEILMRHPDYLVQVETPTTIEPVATVETDCFDADEGWSFLLTLEGDDEEA